MKKKIVTMLLAVAMVCSMAACGSSGNSAASGTASAGSTAPEATAAAPAQEETTTPAGSAEEGSAAETAAAPAGTYGEDVPISDIVKDMEPTELPLSDGSTTFDVWMAAPGTVSQVEDLANSNAD